MLGLLYNVIGWLADLKALEDHCYNGVGITATFILVNTPAMVPKLCLAAILLWLINSDEIFNIPPIIYEHSKLQPGNCIYYQHKNGFIPAALRLHSSIVVSKQPP